MPIAAVIAVFSLVLGLAVLVLMTVNVYEQVKSLARAVARAGERVSGAAPPSAPDVEPREGR